MMMVHAEPRVLPAVNSCDIHAVIISWAGQEDNAHHIANAIYGEVERLTVIYSNADGAMEQGLGVWCRVPNDWFYGKKFQKSLELHSGQVMLQIHADAHFDDWPRLVSRCRQAFNNCKSVGVWAPEVNYSPWLPEFVSTGRFNGGLDDHYCVAQTDGVVWAIADPVVERLRQFEYAENNLGWGVDWAAISNAYSQKLYVLRDASITCQHPKGSGYVPNEAAFQMKVFLGQLNQEERRIYRSLAAFVKRQKSARQSFKKMLNLLVLKLNLKMSTRVTTILYSKH